jgi:hypothetical protein
VGLGAGIQSFTSSAQGCSEEDYFLQGFQTTSHNAPGEKSTIDAIVFDIEIRNFCTGDEFFATAFADASNSNVSVSGTFNKGIHVTASITGSVFDNSGSRDDVPMTVDLTFTPTGTPVHSSFSISNWGRTFVDHFQAKGQTVDASVLGTWVVDGTNYLPASLVPDNRSIQVSQNSQGSLDIIKQ